MSEVRNDAGRLREELLEPEGLDLSTATTQLSRLQVEIQRLRARQKELAASRLQQWFRHACWRRKVLPSRLQQVRAELQSCRSLQAAWRRHVQRRGRRRQEPQSPSVSPGGSSSTQRRSPLPVEEAPEPVPAPPEELEPDLLSDVFQSPLTEAPHSPHSELAPSPSPAVSSTAPQSRVDLQPLPPLPLAPAPPPVSPPSSPEGLLALAWWRGCKVRRALSARHVQSKLLQRHETYLLISDAEVRGEERVTHPARRLQPWVDVLYSGLAKLQLEALEDFEGLLDGRTPLWGQQRSALVWRGWSWDLLRMPGLSLQEDLQASRKLAHRDARRRREAPSAQSVLPTVSSSATPQSPVPVELPPVPSTPAAPEVLPMPSGPAGDLARAWWQGCKLRRALSARNVQSKLLQRHETYLLICDAEGRGEQHVLQSAPRLQKWVDVLYSGLAKLQFEALEDLEAVLEGRTPLWGQQRSPFGWRGWTWDLLRMPGLVVQTQKQAWPQELAQESPVNDEPNLLTTSTSLQVCTPPFAESGGSYLGEEPREGDALDLPGTAREWAKGMEVEPLRVPIAATPGAEELDGTTSQSGTCSQSPSRPMTPTWPSSIGTPRVPKKQVQSKVRCWDTPKAFTPTARGRVEPGAASPLVAPAEFEGTKSQPGAYASPRRPLTPTRTGVQSERVAKKQVQSKVRCWDSPKLSTPVSKGRVEPGAAGPLVRPPGTMGHNPKVSAGPLPGRTGAGPVRARPGHLPRAATSPGIASEDTGQADSRRSSVSTDLSGTKAWSFEHWAGTLNDESVP